MDSNSGIRPWQWVVTVIVILALIALGIFVSTRGGSSTPTTNEPTTTTTPTVTESNRLIVTDQFPGNIVYVSTVQLAANGFVTIHEDKAGTPGAVIGSVYFPKGIGPAKVTLTKNTVDGKTYYAMLHTDVDANKIFAEATDAAIKDIRGIVIMKSFKAREDLPEAKG